MKFSFILLLIIQLSCVHKSIKPTSVPASKKQQMTPQGYLLENGIPVWVLKTNMTGKLGGVGIVTQTSAPTLQERKELAQILAENEISEQISILVKEVCTLKRSLQFSNDIIQEYRHKINCQSIHQANVWLDSTQMMDQWIHPETGDLYIWVILNDI